MTRRFVDLSIFLENDVISDPPAFAPKIQYFTHENTFAQIEPFFPGLKKEDLPDGEGWAVEFVNLSTHNGTHLDAPYHFHSTMDKALGEKKPAIAIHDVPLEWCFQPGVKLDFRHFDDGYVVTFVTDMNHDRSECLVFDARAIDAGPVATIFLPFRISSGTHSCWADDSEINSNWSPT